MGIPLHFWNDNTIHTIAEELSFIDVREMEEAWVRVNMDGLAPLLMTSKILLLTDEITTVKFKFLKF